MARDYNGRLRLKPVRDQVIVITGATSGIGLATAREAARRGARLVLAARGAEALERLRTELATRGCDAVAVPADVGREEDVKRIAMRAAEHFGNFDTWVNNAGVTIYGPLTEISLEDQRRLFDTDFWGVVHGSRVAVEHLRRHGGALINIGSVTCDHAVPLQGIYSAAKHAVKAYTDALRMELACEEAPVSVTLVKPASIDTPFCRHAKNYLPVQPRNPPPLYSPRVAADAILFCAETPRSEVVVGGAAELASMLARAAPRTAERLMQETLFDLQLTDTPAYDTGHCNLHGPGDELDERGSYRLGGSSGVAERSLYTRATLDSDPDALADIAGRVARTFWRLGHRPRWRPGQRH